MTHPSDDKELPIILTSRESLRLLELIENPPPRNEKFLRAMNRYQANASLIRIELIEKEAEQVFGTSDLARDWLTRINPSLGDTPLAMLETDAGAVEVRKLLSAVACGGAV